MLKRVLGGETITINYGSGDILERNSWFLHYSKWRLIKSLTRRAKLLLLNDQGQWTVIITAILLR
ncbi:MAG: hypothetical protein H6910_00150 [Rickettsiaceae bacterium]|nr:hypothetical protein [Rickettsiaceae bacterium]